MTASLSAVRDGFYSVVLALVSAIACGGIMEASDRIDLEFLPGGVFRLVIESAAIPLSAMAGVLVYRIRRPAASWIESVALLVVSCGLIVAGTLVVAGLRGPMQF
jgi:hypothetical protein